MLDRGVWAELEVLGLVFSVILAGVGHHPIL
jgi:hypothetical protein